MTDPTQTPRPGGPEPSAPPRGGDPWEEWIGAGAARPGNGHVPPRMPDLAPLFALVDALRRLVPPELQDQISALQRELLLTIRALIDWYLERLEGGQRAPAVEDIPIE